jgi:Skp family chaperone for outer membrane proteins
MPAPEITELDILVKKLPLDEYQKYLKLDAKAAVLGKFCHSDNAPLVVARRDYLVKLSKPLEKEGTGRDTCVYQFEPSVPKEALEETFEGLQKAYREASKELNKIRFELREKEAQRFQSENAEYQKALADYNRISKEVDDWNSELRKKYLEYRREINRKTQEILAEFEDWRSNERNRVSKLKIIIPKDLQETYEYLESLGKQNKD